MSKTGDVIENPVTGETFTFLKTAADTGGQLLQIDVAVRPNNGLVAPLTHIHPKQEERFIIKAGRLRGLVNGQEKILQPRETMIIPAGAPHDWQNASTEEDLHFICEFEPALHWDELFESIFALAQAGMFGKDGSISPLIMAVGLRAYPDHFYLSSMPVGLQKVLFALLSPIGKVLGYKPFYPYRHG